MLDFQPFPTKPGSEWVRHWALACPTVVTGLIPQTGKIVLQTVAYLTLQQKAFGVWTGGLETLD